MKNLTSQARDILRVVIAHLRDTKVTVKRLDTFLGYKQVHERLGLKQLGDTWGTSLDAQGLGDLARWAKTNELPAVTGLVIDKEKLSPGRKFYTLNDKNEDRDIQWWLDQAALAIKHPWESYLTPVGTKTDTQYISWPDNELEDEVPNFEAAKAHSKSGEPLRLDCRTVGTKISHETYLAIVRALDDRSFVLDYRDTRVWGQNRTRSCQAGYLTLKYGTNGISETYWHGGMESPDEIDPGATEGAQKQVFVSVYERDPINRIRCIEHYGYKCVVCDLDFAKRYGDIGRNFIHVHHLNPLSKAGGSHKIDPVKDLRPVCPNCHAMIHRHSDVGMQAIERLRSLLK